MSLFMKSFSWFRPREHKRSQIADDCQLLAMKTFYEGSPIHLSVLITAFPPKTIKDITACVLLALDILPATVCGLDAHQVHDSMAC
jgi:hypothetical protein